MTGSQEVPPRSSPAVGRGTVIFDEVALTAYYTIRITGLDFGPILELKAKTADPGDDVTSFHVHSAPRGVNGDVVFGQINPNQDDDDLSIVRNLDGSWTMSGRWETTDPATISITSFATVLNSTQIGSDAPLYFNAHTTDFPGGEIRGQWVAIGNEGNNIIRGSVGADFLPGLGGNDIIFSRQGNDSVDGGAGNDRLFGESGNDTVRGGDGNDALVGGSGDDRLIGENGNDRLYGGIGNDRLFGGSGNDFLNGSLGNDILRGDAGNDRLIGGSGNDNLNGGLGNDILYGGADADTFTFNTALGSDNVDTIRGFNSGADIMRLDNAVFTGLSGGSLSATAFYVGASAVDADDRIIYNDQTGALYFDADGSATGSAQLQFATLLGAPDLTRFDFFVF
jgi:Ca2+-binding RTX toxin-like protein